MFGIDAIVGLVSLFGPKLIDLVKGVIHRKDTPEQVMASLASNPAALTEYMRAQAELTRARAEQFNQDLPPEAPTEGAWKWIISLRELLEIYRGAIRPLVVTIALVHITHTLYWGGGPTALALIPEWVRYIYEIAINSWFGDRWK